MQPHPGRAPTVEAEPGVDAPVRIADDEDRRRQRRGVPACARRGLEGDGDDPGGGDRFSDLDEVLAARQSSQVPEQDEDGGGAAELIRGEGRAVRGLKFEAGEANGHADGMRYGGDAMRSYTRRGGSGTR
jgi:hypothetical protein